MTRTDNTQRLDKFIGQYVKVTCNVAKDVHKPSISFGGKLLSNRYYYEIMVTAGTWIVFTDENILHVWDESTPYIEISS